MLKYEFDEDTAVANFIVQWNVCVSVHRAEFSRCIEPVTSCKVQSMSLHKKPHICNIFYKTEQIVVETLIFVRLKFQQTQPSLRAATV